MMQGKVIIVPRKQVDLIAGLEGDRPAPVRPTSVYDQPEPSDNRHASEEMGSMGALSSANRSDAPT